MERLVSEGVELDFEIRGSGEPVLLIHGAAIADSFLPLMEVAELAERYQLVRYHRRGYGGSSRPEGSLSIADHAADARMVLSELDIDRAHIVGHSVGAVVALQLALDAPDLVHTLVLAEPVLLMFPSAAELVGGISPAMHMHMAGESAIAVEVLLELIAGPNFRSLLEPVLPTAIDQAARDSAAFFENDVPALGSWEIDTPPPIPQPTLSILGEHTPQFFADGRPLLHEWLPQTEDLDLPNTGHLMHIENPVAMAAGLTRFFDRHPLDAGAT